MEPKKELKLIEEVLEKFNSNQTSEEVISYALTKLQNHYKHTSCGIIIYDSNTCDFKIKISKGLSHQFVKQFNLTKTHPLIEEVFKKGEPALITKDHPHFKNEGYKLEHEHESLYLAPLKIGGNVIGLAYFDTNEKEPPVEDDLKFFRDFANICALIIDHSDLAEYVIKTSDTDSLTGLYSYKYFHEELNREMSRAKRTKYPVTLMLASVGHLGDYNSVFGHIAGDQAIIAISHIIKENIRDNDIPARYGNKFIIIFPEVKGDDVTHIAQRICKTMDEDKFKGKDPKPTLRIGIASYPKDGGEEKLLIAHAEKNLYESKRKGGNVYTY